MKVQGTANGLVRSNIFLSVAEKAEFQKRAKAEKVSFATLVRRVMADYLGTKTTALEFRTAAK